MTLPSEYQECQTLWEWAQYHPILSQHLIKIVNEGKRTPQAGKRLVDIGLTRHVPDYFLHYPTRRYAGCWIEVKIQGEKNRKLREGQIDYINKLRKVGYYASFAFGFEDARRQLLDYLAEKL